LQTIRDFVDFALPCEEHCLRLIFASQMIWNRNDRPVCAAPRHIVCFGNALHGDDGFGPQVFARLQALALPDDVRLFLGGVAGLNALGCLEGCREAILVDAIAPAGAPGEVTVMQNIRAADFAPEGNDAHGSGVAYLLRALEAIVVPLPRLILVGAQASGVRAFSPTLSPAVQLAVPRAVARIQTLLT
jgi:hydrogenase maturation protease